MHFGLASREVSRPCFCVLRGSDPLTQKNLNRYATNRPAFLIVIFWSEALFVMCAVEVALLGMSPSVSVCTQGKCGKWWEQANDLMIKSPKVDGGR